MRTILFVAACSLCAGAASAADTAHCDATPFTLNKASQTPAKPAVAQPKLAQATPVKPVEARKPVAKPKPKPRLISTCKDGKTKKSG